MRVAFLGSGAFGLPTLERLAAGHELAGIVTQPDRPAGRKRRPTPTPVAAWAGEHAPGVAVVRPEDVNERGVVEQVRGWDAEAWVVIAFGQRLSPGLIEGRFVVNLHASLLPRWRGAAPINWAILAGDARTGNSVITIAERMDAGYVLGQDGVEVDPLETAGELHDRLSARGPDLIERVLGAHASREVEYVEQDESKVTRARKLSKADGVVDFSAEGEACRRRVQGLNPWPGVTVGFRDGTLKLGRAKAEELPAQQIEAPGTILEAESGLVACAPGTGLRLLEVQLPGKRVMSWDEFARGHRVEDGERLSGAERC